MDEHVDASAGKSDAAQSAAPTVETPKKPPPIEQPSGHPDPEKKSDKMSKSDKIMSGATVVIALGTLVSAVAIGLQLGEMKKGGLDTKAIADAAQEQVAAANRFADSADKINIGIGQAVLQLQTQAQKMDTARTTSQETSKKAVDASIAIARSDQRAWVGFADPTFVLNLTDPAKAEVRVLVLGKSPATDIITYAATVGYPQGHKLQPDDLVYARESAGLSNGTVFPGNTFPRRVSGDDPPSERDKANLQLVVNGSYTLYFFGYVTYNDIFKNPHWTHFCYVVNKDLTTASPCAIYNDSDADAPNQKKK